MRKISVVSGTRAEYGLLHWIMRDIRDDPELCLQIIVTGMHLSPEYGLTYQAIEQDGFKIDRKVEMMVSSDTGVGIGKSIGLGLISFSDVFSELKPDLVIVLGDRYEIFSAAIAAHMQGIPIAHLHGGESTEGLIDEAIRHSITKMAQLHFVATEDYRKRVIQLGESPKSVFTVGGLGVDTIRRTTLLEKLELEKLMGLRFEKKNLLITFHPVTLESLTEKNQMKELLNALEDLDDIQLIFTLPNSDAGGRALIQMVNNFGSEHTNVKIYSSLGQLKFLSCLTHVDGIIGNSSSGLLEAPTFKKAAINIGDRQLGRLQAGNIINCEPKSEEIRYAIKKMYSTEFQEKLSKVINPYGNGGASKLIVDSIKTTPLQGILKKTFYDLSNKCG